MARRTMVVVNLLCLSLVCTSCQTVSPRRAARTPRPDPVPQSTTPSPLPVVPPADPQAAAPVNNTPPANPITRVSVPPALPDAAATVKPPEATTPPPAVEPKPSAEATSPRQLCERAASVYAAIDSYNARFRRRERVGDKDMPEEVIFAQFRKQPFSVHFKWIAGEGQGRELIYVQGRHEDKIHTLLAPSDPHLFGKTMALPMDSPLIRSRSRRPITEAGVGHLIDAFGQMLAQADKYPAMQLKLLGPVKRPEYLDTLVGVEHVVLPQQDPYLPKGGHRWWFFDPLRGLPVLLISHDTTGHTVDYYCYDRLMYPIRLDDHDFDPTMLGKK
jgi:hypothetical protein